MGILPPTCQHVLCLGGVCRRAVGELAGPCLHVELEEPPGLLAQGFQIRLSKLAGIVTATAAGLGRGTGGIQPIAGTKIVGQFRLGRKSLGIKAQQPRHNGA